MWKGCPKDEGSLVMSSFHFPNQYTEPKRVWSWPVGGVVPKMLQPLRISSLYQSSFPTLSHLFSLVNSCKTLPTENTSNGSPRSGLKGQGVGGMEQRPVEGGGGEPSFGARSRGPPTRARQSWQPNSASEP